MSHVLCILNDPATADGVLDAGEKLARRLWLDVRVLRPRPDQDPDFMPTEEVMTDQRRAEFEAGEDALTDALTAIMARRQGPPGSLKLDEIRGDREAIVTSAASSATMIVAGAAIGEQRVAAKASIQDLLRAHYGVVVVPSEPLSSIGSRPAIAWKPGQPAEAVVEAAMPVLKAADRVSILIGLEDGNECVEPVSLEQELSQRGVVSTITPVRFGDRHRGQALLAGAEAKGCDLLIMGTHTGNWLRDLLLGGVSRDVLAKATIAVLLHA